MHNISFKHIISVFTIFVSGKAQETTELPNLATSVPTCGECFCVPDDGQVCPGTRANSFEIIGDQLQFVTQEVANPYTLDCNPYIDAQCETAPPQEFISLGTEAVCGIHYLVPASIRLCPRTYKIQSYPNQLAAESDGAVVTHVGSCGVCSTTRDLATFMSSKDLTPAVSKCLVKVTLLGITLENLIECVEEIGLTYECANLLSLNAIALSRSCVARCQNSIFGGQPNQGGSPNCELSDCITCANDFTLPVFESFAGRDAHRSGILAGYAYPCSENVNITHEVCPKFNEMGAAPTFTTSPLPAVTSMPSIAASSGFDLYQLTISHGLMGLTFIVGALTLF